MTQETVLIRINEDNWDKLNLLKSKTKKITTFNDVIEYLLERLIWL